MKLSVLIPAFNEEKTIKSLLSRVYVYCSPENVWVIDDGSTDNTRTLLVEEPCNLLIHKQNLGKGGALRTGFNTVYKNYDAVITLDADLQHAPESIPSLIKAAEDLSADIVIGSRANDLSKMPFHRIVSNKLTSFFISTIIGQPIEDSQSGFRLIKTDVLKKITLTLNEYDLESELLLKSGKLGFQITSVPIQTIYNASSSKIKPIRDTYNFIKLIFRSMFK